MVIGCVREEEEEVRLVAMAIDRLADPALGEGDGCMRTYSSSGLELALLATLVGLLLRGVFNGRVLFLGGRAGAREEEVVVASERGGKGGGR